MAMWSLKTATTPARGQEKSFTGRERRVHNTGGFMVGIGS
jgi:hypothetical protein